LTAEFARRDAMNQAMTEALKKPSTYEVDVEVDHHPVIGRITGTLIAVSNDSNDSSGWQPRSFSGLLRALKSSPPHRDGSAQHHSAQRSTSAWQTSRCPPIRTPHSATSSSSERCLHPRLELRPPNPSLADAVATSKRRSGEKPAFNALNARSAIDADHGAAAMANEPSRRPRAVTGRLRTVSDESATPSSVGLLWPTRSPEASSWLERWPDVAQSTLSGPQPIPLATTTGAEIQNVAGCGPVQAPRSRSRSIMTPRTLLRRLDGHDA
jgi:hypothetical protein